MRTDEPDGKQFLNRLLKYATVIEEKQAELRYWREGESSSPQGEENGDILLRAGELEAEISKLKRMKLVATQMIDKIEDPVARAILRRRYILCETWAKIARACGGMSQRNAHYIHDNGIIEFNKIYENTLLCS